MDKLFVIGVIKLFNISVSPGFADWNKNRCHLKVQAKPDDQAQWARIAVAASKIELVIQLQIVGHTNGFPASEQTVGNLSIRFAALRLNKNAMTVYIHKIEWIKFAIAFDVTRTDKIGLVNIIKVKCISEIRIFDALGNIWSFF